jgi:hypothetical protein
MNYWKNKYITQYGTIYNNKIIEYDNPDKITSNIYEINPEFDIKYIDDNNIFEFKIFLDKYYEYVYSLDTLKWIIFNPFSIREFNILLYYKDNIIGSIVGIKKSIMLFKKKYDCLNVTLLCIDPLFRYKNLHFYLIDILMKNAKSNNIILALFNTNKEIKYIKYFKVDNTYMTYGNNKLKSSNIDKFDFNAINNKKYDLYFVYSEQEYCYWFNNTFVTTIIYDNNFIALLHIHVKTKNGNVPINIILEFNIFNNNINKKYIPNNTIVHNNYSALKCVRLETKLYSYIYNFGFYNLNSSIYLL